MQARLTAERWLQGNIAPKKPYESEEELEKLRKHMHDEELDVPQFWFSDYLGYMELVHPWMSFQGWCGMIS